MIAGLSPLMWTTGGSTALTAGGVVSDVVDGALLWLDVDDAPIGDGFARPADADWLNRAESWALVMHTGLWSVGPSVTHSFCTSIWSPVARVNVSSLVVKLSAKP